MLRPTTEGRPKVRVLIPAWGEAYISQLTDLALPSLLAPGNLPALAAVCDCEVVLLGSRRDEEQIRRSPVAQAVRRVCPFSVLPIDDLITDGVYGVVLTLAYLRGITATGAEMTNTHFLFFNCDFVLAEGSLHSLSKHVLKGSRVIVSTSLRAVEEDVKPLLQTASDDGVPRLAIRPRELVAIALENLHRTTTAKIVQQGLFHSVAPNQFYWRADEGTLVGRCFLTFMLCLRPERIIDEIHCFCDYAFIPELCPSAEPVVLTDSDEFFMLELQKRESERELLRLGEPTIARIARSLSEWTTREHRRFANETFVFRSGEPGDVTRIRRESDAFIDALTSRLSREPKPHDDHPYWHGAIAAWKSRLGAAAGSGAVAGTEPRAGPRGSPAGARGLYDAVFGIPPLVRPWHRDWLDYRRVGRELQRHLRAGGEQMLCIASDGTPFDRLIARSEVPVRRLSPANLAALERGALPGACFLCLAPEDLPRLGEIWQRLARVLPRGARVLLYVGAAFTRKPGTDLAGLAMHHIPSSIPSLASGQLALSGSVWPLIARQLHGLASRLHYRLGFWGAPLVIGLVGLDMGVSALSNLAQLLRRSDGERVVCTSIFCSWEHEGSDPRERHT